MGNSDAPPPTLMRQRLVAFLDVLGFSELLRKRSLLDLHQEYARLIDEARSKVFDQIARSPEGEVRQSNFDFAQFAYDSIVLVSRSLDEDGPRSAFHFFAATCQLMETCAGRKMPLRGAVGVGDFLVDAERQLFLSPVLPELVELEQLQEWTGAVVLPAAEALVLDALNGVTPEEAQGALAMRDFLVVRASVPLKQSSSEDHWCVNWVHHLDEPALDELLGFLIEPKRKNTREFVEHVRRLPTWTRAAPPEAKPAVTVSFQCARAGFRLKLADDRGCGVDPPGDFSIELPFAVPGPPPAEGT